MTASTHPVEREQLMAYLDGELAANEAARVAAHLADCAECRQLEVDLRSVSTQMLTWNVEPAPPQISDGVLEALRANPPQNSDNEPRSFFQIAFQHRIRIARWGLAAACFGVAAMILLKMFVPQQNTEPQRMEVSAKVYPAPIDSLSMKKSGGGGGGGDREESKVERP